MEVLDNGSIKKWLRSEKRQKKMKTRAFLSEKLQIPSGGEGEVEAMRDGCWVRGRDPEGLDLGDNPRVSSTYRRGAAKQ